MSQYYRVWFHIHELWWPIRTKRKWNRKLVMWPTSFIYTDATCGGRMDMTSELCPNLLQLTHENTPLQHALTAGTTLPSSHSTGSFLWSMYIKRRPQMYHKCLGMWVGSINLSYLHKVLGTDTHAVYSTLLLGTIKFVVCFGNTEEPKIHPSQKIWINVLIGSEEDRNVWITTTVV
jgi:hypothetical protein